jgi:hypothetical protein
MVEDDGVAAGRSEGLFVQQRPVGKAAAERKAADTTVGAGDVT